MLLLAFMLMIGSALGLQPGVSHAEAIDQGVTISAVDQEGENVLPLTAVSIEEDMSAFDVLKQATDKQDVELGSEKHADFGMMIKQIGEVTEDEDHYWAFLPQGKAAQTGASSYQVDNGDHIQFKFASMSDQSDTSGMTISVSAADGDNQVIEQTDIELAPGSTVYDALYQAADDLNVSVDDQSFQTIHNINQVDLSEQAEWVYSVNGTTVEQPAVQHSLDDGDSVVFEVQTSDGSTNEEDSEDSNESEQDEEKPNEEGESSDQDQTDGSNKSAENVQAHIDDLLNYINQNVAMTYGSETWIWGLAHTDYDIKSSYIDSVREEVDTAKGDFSGLELQKIIISLSLLGEDATDFAGYNLLDLLFEESTPLINDSIYTLLAVDSNQYEAPEDFRKDLINDILKAEKEGGGWTYYGEAPTVDITSMALAALAPYQEDADVKASSDRAVQFLSQAQQDNGGFYNKINGGDTSESVSQAIVGLASIGIDPTSNQFTKNGNNLLDHLEAFKHDNGGFKHTLDVDRSSPLSTQQALLAYVAYDQLNHGGGLVYQQSETGNGNDGKEDEETPDENDQGENPEMPEEPSDPDPESKPDPKPDEDSTNQTQDDNNDPEQVTDNNDNDNEQAGQVENNNTNNKGETLPDTATSMFNYLIAGLVLVIIGGAYFLIRRIRSSKA